MNEHELERKKMKDMEKNINICLMESKDRNLFLGKLT